MRYRNSLRFRIFATFLATGLLLGPLLAMAFITLANELEEFAIKRALAERLTQVMASSEGGRAVADSAHNWRVYGDIDLADIPAQLAGANGIFTIESGKAPQREGSIPEQRSVSRAGKGRSWFLAVGQQRGVSYIVASDQTMLELRESLSTWVILAGTLLSVCASLWFGYYITSRLIQPLQKLAAATAGDDGDANRINPQDYPPDEIGQLASALRRRHDELMQALVREKAFSAEVAHELRNPLAVIQSTMEIIERDIEPGAPSGRALERAVEAIGEMNETFDALLLLGREHTAPLLSPPVDVAMLVQAVLDKYHPQNGGPLQLQQQASPVLYAPSAAIRMIVDNLVRNAVQHTPAGLITVSLHSDRLTVQDSGIGIAGSEINAVRGHGIRGSNALGSGSGLGLALVDRLCATFGWRLELHSEEQVGTTATWWFASPPAPSD